MSQEYSNFPFFFFCSIIYTFILIVTNSVTLLALLNQAHGSVRSLLLLSFDMEPMNVLLKFWINTEEQLSAANNLMSCFWPFTSPFIWQRVFLEVVSPCLVSWVGLLELNRMSELLSWSPFSLEWGELIPYSFECGRSAKQTINWLGKKKKKPNRRESKTLGGFWERLELL